MKKTYFLHILVLAIFFIGCNNNQQIIIQKVEPPKANQIKKVVKKEKPKPTTKPIEKKKVEIKSDDIAILFPSKIIGKYAQETTHSINIYLISKNSPFTLKVFDTLTFDKYNILQSIKKIQKQHIVKVIAMLTKEQLSTLNEIENIDKITFYLPLINKNDILDVERFTHLHLIFGAIDYSKQFRKLITYTTDKQHLVEFYDNSAIGYTLHKYLKPVKLILSKKIDDNNRRYKSFLSKTKKLKNSTLILNTPIIKSSILLSNISAVDLEVKQILSTELNFTPLLFSLTQKLDRKNLIIASSIGYLPKYLEQYGELIGDSFKYNWVNYSAIIGTQYLLYNNIDSFKDIKIQENQIIYPVYLYKVGKYSFKRIDSK